MKDVEAGQADIVDTQDLDPAQLSALRRTYPGQLPCVFVFNVNWVTLNTTPPPFTDVRVRTAINDAVDRRVITSLVGGDRVARPTCQILPQGFPGYRPYCPYADPYLHPRSPKRRRWSLNRVQPA